MDAACSLEDGHLLKMDQSTSFSEDDQDAASILHVAVTDLSSNAEENDTDQKIFHIKAEENDATWKIHHSNAEDNVTDQKILHNNADDRHPRAEDVRNDEDHTLDEHQFKFELA